jgi:hypothetical protein
MMSPSRLRSHVGILAVAAAAAVLAAGCYVVPQPPLTGGAGPTTTTTTAPPPIPKVIFGQGPEADGAAKTALATHAPLGMLTSWYNSANDLSWMAGWRTGQVPRTYAAGQALHLVVYSGDAETAFTTGYGPACGRAYPLSDRFIGDMTTLAKIFAGSASGPPLYVTMFTEFQTYPCVDNAWAATPAATNYYKALKDQYLRAVTVFHQYAPNSKVSLGWGGWQASFDSPSTGGGRSLFPYFADAMRVSDFQSFQAMGSDSNIVNIEQMTQTLSAYGPVMLAHYKPNNGSQATFDADLRALLTDQELTRLTHDGLFAMSFMDNKNLAAEPAIEQFVEAAVSRYAA